MSVLNPAYTNVYTAAGTTGPYPITFSCILDISGNAQDIVVEVVDSAGLTTDITSTCTIVGLNVYTAVAYDATNTIVLVRYPDVTQPYTFPFGTKFPSKTFENALDRLLYLVQRGSGDADLALKAPFVEVATPPARLPTIADRASKHLAFDANGDPVGSLGVPSVPATSFAATLLDDATAAAARTTLDVYSKAEADALVEDHLEKTLTIDETVADNDLILQFATKRLKPHTPVTYVNGTAALVGTGGQNAVFLTDALIIHAWEQGTTINVRAGAVADDLTISWGTTQTITATGAGDIVVARLSDTSFIVGYTTASLGAVVAGTVSGTAVTLGSGTTYNAAATGSVFELIVLSATKFIVAYTDSGTTYCTACCATVSGTTISFGAEYANGTIATNSVGGCMTGTDEVFITYRKTAGNLVHGKLVTAAGTVLTWGTEVAITVPADSNSGRLPTFKLDDYSVGVFYFRTHGAAYAPGGIWMAKVIRRTTSGAFGSSMDTGTRIADGAPSIAGDSLSWDAGMDAGVAVVFSASEDTPTYSTSWLTVVSSDGRGHRVGCTTRISVADEFSSFFAGRSCSVYNRKVAVCRCNSSDYADVTLYHIPSVIGIASGAGTSVPVVLRGYKSGFAGLTPGLDYYAHPDGTLTTSRICDEAFVGKAISATEVVR